QGKILAEFNLSHQALQNPFTLSEGQKRRLSLAIALSQHPQLILLDEPSFGQDYANKIRLIEYINALALTGVSFIMVSHDLNFVNALSQKVYELRAGELVSC
ncbi:MAG: energy-coupling factor transport system ATP-binding protein, partial [Pseudomonadota bacterium]|nr:energy-coupling factor transport system ATP-binding protein [Pseudomonadota bacterium]